MNRLRTKVDFFYDVVSPYSWFGFEAICRYKPIWNMDLTLRPFFLGGVMKATGNRPPMMVSAKALYMQKDLRRNAEYFDVPLNVIENPFEVMIEKGTMRAQRFLTALNLNHPEHVEEVSRQLWMRIWSKSEDIVEDASLQTAAESAGVPAEAIKKCLGLIEDPAVKEKLKATTEEALELGAFGAPAIIVYTPTGPEHFMGSDRFPLVAAALKEKWLGPVPAISKL